MTQFWTIGNVLDKTLLMTYHWSSKYKAEQFLKKYYPKSFELKSMVAVRIVIKTDKKFTKISGDRITWDSSQGKR